MNKILIIDDDKELCALIKRSVQAENIEADFCNTGKEGLQKLREQEYQLVVLDVMMPGMDDTNSSTGTVTYTYQGNPVGKAAVTLSDEYLQKDNTENEAQVSGDKSDSETQKQAQSTIPREVILVICVIAAVLILIIVWRAVLKHLRKKKVETNRKRRREVDKD